ncbi:MAG TPA: site-2 protease family protein [Polyangiaceae bacterium]|nr:site-2 protease family protein [Polyangiaceae bacterium]
MSGLSPPELIRLLALDLLVMVLSLSVHECAHAWVAHRLGDDTAARQGRLSLSPATHVDPLGTLLIPALSIIMGGAFGFIGWARPVPVEPRRFRSSISMRGGMALVAAAGPLSNLVLALLALGIFALCKRADVGLWDDAGRMSGAAALLVTMFHVNVGLMVFNFLPIPPLDGSRLLPRSMDALQARLAPYSIVLLLLIINVPILSRYMVLEPIRVVANVLQTLFQTQIFDGIA